MTQRRQDNGAPDRRCYAWLLSYVTQLSLVSFNSHSRQARAAGNGVKRNCLSDSGLNLGHFFTLTMCGVGNLPSAWVHPIPELMLMHSRHAQNEQKSTFSFWCSPRMHSGWRVNAALKHHGNTGHELKKMVEAHTGRGGEGSG